MGFTPKDWVSETDHAGPPASPPGTPISGASLEDLEIRVTDYADLAGGGIFNVQHYGAVADGTTDDSPAIADAETAARLIDGIVFYPPSANAYMISEPLSGDVSHVGSGRNGSIIGALAGLGSATNKMMLDLGVGAYSTGIIKDLTFDGNAVSDVQLIASSRGRYGNFNMRYEGLRFTNCDEGVYALGPGPGSDTGDTSGLFVGAVFFRCEWDECAHALWLGVNSDDVTFIAPRFKMVDGVTTNTIGPCVRVSSGDVTFQNMWIQVGDSGWQPAGNYSCFLEVNGNLPVRIENFALEGIGGSTDMVSIFRASSSPIVIDTGSVAVTSGGTTAPELTEIVAANTAAATHFYADLRNLTTSTDETIPLLEIQISTGTVAGGGTFQYHFDGVDDFDDILDVTGETDNVDVIQLHGVHRGRHLGHSTNGSRWGLAAAVASAATVTLPSDGFVVVTGTADITSITASWPGRVVTLAFMGNAATNGIVDGSNLLLASTFQYTGNDTITLGCDGTNWYEIARSVN